MVHYSYLQQHVYTTDSTKTTQIYPQRGGGDSPGIQSTKGINKKETENVSNL